ncbi:MAG: tetratricopeptide repeat protein [Candidatus Obscuribacterales bacterium]|mgnify:CR=1 FL=1
MFRPPSGKSSNTTYATVINAWDMLQAGTALDDVRWVLEWALVQCRQSYGKYTEEEYWIQVGLADSIGRQSNSRAACTLLLVALVQVSAEFGETHVLSGLAMLELARSHALLGRFAPARVLMDEGLRVLEKAAALGGDYSSQSIHGWVSSFDRHAALITREAPEPTKWNGLDHWIQTTVQAAWARTRS